MAKQEVSLMDLEAPKDRGNRDNDDNNLPSTADEALKLAVNYSLEGVEQDGHWYGELKSNATITAEYVFLRQALGLDLKCHRDALCLYFFSDQKIDGSWGIAPGDYPGDISTTVEAYLALRILGVPADAKTMLKARNFALSAGGVAKVRIFTRIFLATFGLFPWSAIPSLPAELILLPSSAVISIYRFSSWARSTIVPLLIVAHHRPIFRLPSDEDPNTFLNELWCDPSEKAVPYSDSLQNLWMSDRVAFMFAAIDKALHFFGCLSPYFFLRGYAKRECLRWVLEHQEDAGDWAGIFPPMYFGVMALILEGYRMTDDRVVRSLEAIERFAWQDSTGKRIQSCVSPVWDTVLTAIALCDAGLALENDQLVRALEWVKARQINWPRGDFQVYRPHITPGGFSFEYYNTWYPDVDDTAAAILAFIKQDPKSLDSISVMRAVEWVLGMQNDDGGFAAFDVNNNKFFLNKIPFSDLNSLCDPSTADVTGRVLEALGLFMQYSDDHCLATEIIPNIEEACDRAISYLTTAQEPTGSWYGRWGSNYVYGTSNVLCGLAYFPRKPRVKDMLSLAVEWLKRVQNDDGGWGEELDTYQYPERAGRGTSTASQTAWAVMALLADLPPEDYHIQRGISFLISRQTSRKGS
ncbi:MAG: hypothetical protein Q9214_006548, partial [Letrouitia sp. 1 TL-2023]